MRQNPHIFIRINAVENDYNKISALWKEIGWGENKTQNELKIRKSFKSSPWKEISEINNELVGYARALSDNTLVTYLAEVAVFPKYRKMGVGSSLVAACVETFKQTSIYADALPSALGMNIRNGLHPRPKYLIACSRGPSA